MNPRVRALIQLTVVLVAIVFLFLFFPAANAFVARAARDLRYFWWLILLVALAIWLIWGIGRKPKR
jgi:uncharacterized protein with PQ loop repeat